jgi:hypothetical protein
VGSLRAGLGLARNLRTRGGLNAVRSARMIEFLSFQGLYRWLEGMQGHGDLLRRALAVLRRHEAEMPADPNDALRADYVIAQNTLDHPEGWLVAFLNRRAKEGHTTATPAQVAAVALAWRTPWERERLRRLLVNLYEETKDYSWDKSWGVPWLRRLKESGRWTVASLSRTDLVHLRAAVLCVALRVEEEATGALPATLNALVPGCLPVIPADPYDGRPFRYRVSAGEFIEWPRDPRTEPGPPLRVPVPAGRGILWSIGENRTDDGGKKQGYPPARESGEDIIFLVPPPAQL